MNDIPFVDLKAQYETIKDEIDSVIKDVIGNTSFIGGKGLEAFADSLARTTEAKYALPVGNGTDAIYIALKQLGIGEGDEVITTAHSWISTSETISQTGAKPIFVDTNKFYCIDETLIEQKINTKTKAIVPVHLYGHPCDMTKVCEIAKKHNLYVVEDCAQSILTKWSDINVGTFGDAGTISFFPGKNLGAYGDAGAIITNDESLFTKMKMFANHGSLVKHQHLIEGINSRMDTLQAEILNVKIKYIEKWISARRTAADIYRHNLEEVQEIYLPEVSNKAHHTYHLFVIQSKKRDDLINYLREKNISTGIHYPKALPMLECYKSHKLDLEDYPEACKNSSRILSLPIFPEIREDQIKFVSQNIKDFYRR